MAGRIPVKRRQSGWPDSNRRPLAPKASALTKLRYSPMAAERPVGKATASKVLRPLPVTPHQYVVGMRPDVPQDLLDRAGEWDDLHRWERSELGKALRRLGLTYGEIRDLIPVPKGTLSDWCRDIRLSPEQIAAIESRSSPSSRRGIPVDTQGRRRIELAPIRAEARDFAQRHLDESVLRGRGRLVLGRGIKDTGTVARSPTRILQCLGPSLRGFERTSTPTRNSCSPFISTRATTTSPPGPTGAARRGCSNRLSPRPTSRQPELGIGRTTCPTESAG